jgi:hypothetical protein
MDRRRPDEALEKDPGRFGRGNDRRPLGFHAGGSVRPLRPLWGKVRRIRSGRLPNHGLLHPDGQRFGMRPHHELFYAGMPNGLSDRLPHGLSHGLPDGLRDGFLLSVVTAASAFS